jgi:hypothetical protein
MKARVKPALDCEKRCADAWIKAACLGACNNINDDFWRNLQDTPDKFGPVVDPFSGGFPSPTWAMPTPSGKTIQYSLRSESTNFYVYVHKYFWGLKCLFLKNVLLFVI